MRERPRPRHLRLARSAIAALALTPTTFAQSVLVVDDDGGPGVDHQTLEAAVAAGSSGDTILVRSGTYSTPLPFLEIDKGVTITAETGAVFGQLPFRWLFTGLAAGEVAVLRGLDPARVDVVASEGVVVLDTVSTEQARVTDSTLVVTDSALTGIFASPVPFAVPGDPGLVTTNSQVFVHDSTLSGGDGWPGSPGSHGSSAVSMDGGFLLLSGTALEIGALPSAQTPLFDSQSPTSEVAFRDSNVDGSDLALTQWTELAGASKPLTAAPFVREGELLTIEVGGDAGETAFVWAGLGLGPTFVDSVGVALLLNAPPASVPLFQGVLDANGSLQRSFTVGSPGAGVEALPVFLQAYVWDPVAAVFVETSANEVLLLAPIAPVF